MYVEIFSSDILNLLIELFSSLLRIFYSSRECNKSVTDLIRKEVNYFYTSYFHSIRYFSVIRLF